MGDKRIPSNDEPPLSNKRSEISKETVSSCELYFGTSQSFECSISPRIFLFDFVHLGMFFDDTVINTTSVSVNSGGSKCRSNRLENIEEEAAAEFACPQPETPTESMEFLARSWSVSASELSKALCNTQDAAKHAQEPQSGGPLPSNQPLPTSETPPVSPRGSDEAKEFFLLHQALNPEFISNRQLIRNALYRNLIMKRKTMGRWIKDQKERKRQEIRAQNAQLHAAVSVAGVAAAVAALAASSVTSPEKPIMKHEKSSKTSTAMASAAALVASHCMEIAEDMGADRHHILSVVNSAINARTNGDVMTLTAGAATALRGAATLRARLNNEVGTAAIALKEESNISAALNFISKGSELLKRTRKGDLHWKQVSINMNSNWQVVAKMKSKHMGGTFTKKKKCVVSGVYTDIQAWPGRETERKEEKAYFAIQTADRVIEFECRNKEGKQMWVEGIQQMLHLHVL